jgi:phosphate:Na+ symporter
LALLNWIGPFMVTIEPDAARAVADFHTAFNLAIAVLFLPLLRPFARLLKWLLPARAAPTDPSQPIYLNEAARETPAIALAGAAREALRMADVLEAMLRNALDAIDRGDRKLIAATKGLDNVLDRLNGAIKAYLTALDPDVLDEEDNCRLAEILAFATNLEHAGDIVEKGLMAIAAKRLKRGLAFSVEGQAEILAMLERLAANVQAAAAVFMTDDARAARRLLGEKEVFRDLEARATEAHFARIRAGAWKASKPALYISTCCATSSGSTPISQVRPTRCLKSSASCCRAVCGVTSKLMKFGRSRQRRVIGRRAQLDGHIGLYNAC